MRILSSLFILLTFITPTMATEPVSTAITYQGLLRSGDAPLTEFADLRFRLYDAPVAGAQVGAQQDVANYLVVDGLISVELDFGPGAFSEEQRWLEIAVRALGDSGYTTLSPRQRITPAPLAGVALKPWTISDQSISFTDGLVGIGTAEPQILLHITDDTLDFDSSALLGEDLLIEANDAIISLMSTPGGFAGSGVMFKEIADDGMLNNQWGLYRGTSGAGSSLILSYGTSANYTTNPPLFTFLTDGTIKTPIQTRTRYFSAPTATVISSNGEINVSLFGPTYSFQSTDQRNAIAAFPLDLPVGASITELSAGVSDFTPDGYVSVVITSHVFGSEVTLEENSVETTFADQGGHRVISEVFTSPTVIEEDVIYYLEVRLLGFTGGTQFIDAKIAYTTDTIE